MATWITRLSAPGTGIRLAVKDAIDVEGVPTTVGCPAIADSATQASADAACLAGARAAGARLVGKANLHELCFGTTGVNEFFGTPVNPLDPQRIPGGSSSGSAVAVANEEADIGFGTDTGGSVRLPAACCGVVGLKTTFGRVPLEGVWPLSPSLDTVGPLARTVDDVAKGMELLDADFSTDGVEAATVVGRLRIAGVDPLIEEAIDAALKRAEFEVVEVVLPGWDAVQAAFGAIILTEAWASDRALVEGAPHRIGATTLERLRFAAMFTDEQVEQAHAQMQAWRDELSEWFERVQVFALPTLLTLPPLLTDRGLHNQLTSAFNLPGTPALAMPVPIEGQPQGLPASLQVVGPWDSEDMLCATGRVVEQATAAGRT